MNRLIMWALINAALLIVWSIAALVVMWSWLFFLSSIAAIIVAIIALVEVIRRRKHSVAAYLYGLSAIVSGAGFASWYFLSLGAINIFGLFAMALGSLGLLPFSLFLRAPKKAPPAEN